MGICDYRQVYIYIFLYYCSRLDRRRDWPPRVGCWTRLLIGWPTGEQEGRIRNVRHIPNLLLVRVRTYLSGKKSGRIPDIWPINKYIRCPPWPGRSVGAVAASLSEPWIAPQSGWSIARWIGQSYLMLIGSLLYVVIFKRIIRIRYFFFSYNPKIGWVLGPLF